VLSATFVRTQGERDRIYVRRSDGSEVSWAFPTYGDGLPHDLVHLVVEAAFGLSDGFWGRVDGGVDPRQINHDANRGGGRDKYAAFGADRSRLLLAETLANAPWRSAEATHEQLCAQLEAACGPSLEVSPEAVRRVRQFLDRTAASWRGLRPSGSLRLDFDRADPKGGFDRAFGRL
jgi:hypothetical protein